MGCLLVKSLVTSTLVTQPGKNGYGVERIVCYSYCCPHLGRLLEMSGDPFHCDNRAIVVIWENGSTQAPQTMALVRLLYFCAAYHNTNVYIVCVCNDIADSLSLPSRWTDSEGYSPTGKSASKQHPCMANVILHGCLLQCYYHGIAFSTWQAYQSGWRAFLSFCSKFSISPLPAFSLISVIT